MTHGLSWTEYAWLVWAGQWALDKPTRQFYSATATHDRRVARRVCRRAGIRWMRVTRTRRLAKGMGYGTKRRLYWFDDDDLARWAATKRNTVTVWYGTPYGRD